MRHFELDLLRTLVAIADGETFAAAADKTHRTQSAVTQQMQRLEAFVGQPLFEKQGRNKRLTPHGVKLVQHARHLLALNDDTWRALQDDQVEGLLRLGAPHDVADTILPTVLTQVSRHLPRIKLEIRVDRSPFLMKAMAAGEIDLTISTRYDPDLEGVVLRTSPTVWICSADYVHDTRTPVRLVLADEPSIFRRLALDALEQARVRWHTHYVAPNLVGIKAALRAGLGVTARSIELLGPDLRVLGEKDGLPPLPEVNYFLWLRREPVNALSRHVYDMLKDKLGLADPADAGAPPASAPPPSRTGQRQDQ